MKRQELDEHGHHTQHQPGDGEGLGNEGLGATEEHAEHLPHFVTLEPFAFQVGWLVVPIE